jgi:hypothetical protein
MKFAVATVLFASLLALTGSAAAQGSRVLLLKSHIALPDVKGRIDHFSVDVKGQRLFMAGVGNHTRILATVPTRRKLGREVNR